MERSPASQLFSDHSRHWRTNRYVYPVISRRSRGLSIGINLNPDRVCNFDCIYCCVNRTTMPQKPEVDLPVLAEELQHLLKLARSGRIFEEPPFDQTPTDLRRINDVALSGDGEPTSYPHFGRACEIVVKALQRAELGHVRIVLITNATLLHRTDIQQALAFLDRHNGEIWAKLDAGTEAYFRLIDRTSIPLQRVLDNILAAGRVRPIVIQSLFMNVAGQGPDDDEIAAYCQRLRELGHAGCRIARVQVYTVARSPAVPSVSPLPVERLDQIAARVREAGFTVETFYAPA